MTTPLAIAGAVAAVLAAGIHVYIFVLESVLWTRPATRRTFGVRSEEDAEVLRPMAFNQGVYNLFLALGVLVGLTLLGTGAAVEAGIALVLFALSCMVLAALVLVISNPRMLRAALAQGAVPAVAIVLVVLALSR